MKTKISNNNIHSISIFSLSILLIIFTVIGFTGCERIQMVYGRVTGTAEAAEPEIPIFAVNTTLAVEGQIQDYIPLSGDIWAGSTVDVYSDAAGRVYDISVSVGQHVNRGAAIAVIDPSRPGMTFRHSVAAAPISGTIVALPAQVGMTITQAVPLARISAAGGLEIRLNVAERFISRVALNQPCTITLDAWPGEVFTGSITEISPTVDLASRTMEVRVNVRDTGSMLKPGMFAKVRIITQRKENIVKIPATAVINRFGEMFVFVVDKDPDNPEINVVRRRNIIPGILIDGVMEIESGLAPNEEIVIRGHTLLDDGSRVNIIEQTTPLSPAVNTLSSRTGVN